MIADWKLDFMAKEVIGNLWRDKTQSVINAYSMICECYVEEPTTQQKKMKLLKDKISKLQNKIDNLIDMRAEGELTKSEYLATKKKFDVEMLELKTELDTYKEEHQSQNEFESKLKRIKEVFETTIDFTQAKLPEHIIDRFVCQITPIDNNLFRWYIRLTDDSPIEEYLIGVEGRKNNPMVLDEDNKIHLPNYYGNTGCYQQQVIRNSPKQ